MSYNKPNGKECEKYLCVYMYTWASLVAQMVKNPPAMLGSNPGSRRSLGGGHGNPLQYSYLENPHGQRSLATVMGFWRVGHSEQLSTRIYVYICICQFSSVQLSRPVMSDSLQPLRLQHTRLPVHHQLLEFTQTHVRGVGDAIQPSHPLSSPSPPAFSLP